MARKIARITSAPDNPNDPEDLEPLTAEAPPFSVERREEGSASVVTVLGEIDIATAPRVAEAVAAPQGLLVLDLSAVEFMDTSGIRLIVELLRAEQEGGAELVVVAAHSPVLRLLDMAGLTSRLRIAAGVGEALG